MDFYNRHIAGGNRIAQSYTRVRVAGSIEDHRFISPRGFLNPSNQFSFIITLTKFNLGTPFSLLAHRLLYILQRGGAVNVRLTLAKKV